MSNFSPKLQDATDEQLEKTIEVFNNQSSKQADKLVKLTPL